MRAPATSRPRFKGRAHGCRQRRCRRDHAERRPVAKKQWIAYIGVAILSTLLTKTLNDLIERRLAADDADVA